MAGEGWIGDLQGVKDVLISGVVQPRVATINLIGATGSYNSALNRLDITVGAGGGGGSEWRVGSGAPNNSVGVDGDMYLQTSNNSIWKRLSGVYVLQGTLTAVAPSRVVGSGAGLTGGGDLSADRTLAVGAHADGSIVVNADDIQVGVLATDAQHGVRGGGTQHALATTGLAGFMSSTDKSKLDGIASGATALALASTTPAAIGTAAIGIGTTAARADHVHAHGDLAGGTFHAVATTSSPGFMSDGDKTKLDGIAAGATSTPLSSTTPAAIGTAAVGVGTTAARSDHVHAHGDQLGGTLHAIATTSVAGFLSAADKSKLDGIAAGATALSLSSTPPAAIGTAAVGVGTTAARADHVHAHGDQLGGSLHAIATTTVAGFLSAGDKTKLDGVAAGATNTPLSSTTPAAIGTAAVGVGTTAARADHVHAHGDQLGGTLHAIATTSTAGFLSAGDKTKLDGIAAGATALSLSSSAGAAVSAAAAIVGSGTTAARSDHTHQVGVGSPVSIGAANSDGSATTLARSDHVHAHGNQLGGTLHAVASTADAGFMSASDKTKLNGIATGATNTPLSDITPNPIAAAGWSGLQTFASRSDHTHAHGSQAGGSTHSLVTTLNAGFMSPADKIKIDSVASGAGAPTITETVQHLYLASTGSDANSGASSGLPVLTLAGAYARAGAARHIVIHVASGTYAWAVKPGRLATQQISIMGDGAGQSGDDGCTQLHSGVTAAGTDTGGITIAAGPAADTLRGATLQITSGVASGTRSTIRDNTTTRIVPCWPYTPDYGSPDSVGVGVNFRVTRPAVTFSLASLEAAGENIIAEGSDRALRGLFLVNVKLTTSDGDHPAFVVGAGMRLFGVEMVGPMLLTDSEVDAGYVDDSPYRQWAADVGAPSGPEWLGYGLSDPSATNASVSTLYMVNSVFRGVLVTGTLYPSGWNYLGDTIGTISLMGGSSVLGSVLINGGTFKHMVPTALFPPITSSFAGCPSLKAGEIRIINSRAELYDFIVDKPASGLFPSSPAFIVSRNSECAFLGPTSITCRSSAAALSILGSRVKWQSSTLGSISAVGGGVALSIGAGELSDGGLHLLSTVVTCSGSTSAVAVDIAGGALSVDNGSTFTASSSANTAANLSRASRMVVDGGLILSGTTGLRLEGASVADLATANSLSITGTAGPGLRATGRSIATLAGGGSCVIGGSTYGIDASGDGHVNAAAAISAVTGTTAQTLADFGSGVVIDNINLRVDLLEQRTHTAGAGLTGGGNHLSDWTLNVGAHADGSIIVNANDIQVGVISDGQHGTRGGGTQHALVTTSVHGFMSSTDKAKLDAILSDLSPQTVGMGNGPGTSTSASRADHTHFHGELGGGTLHAIATTTVPGFLSAGDKTKLDAMGVLSNATPALVSAAAGVPGVAIDMSRRDHTHQVSVASPVTIGSTNSDGSSNSLARADHQHAHGNQAGGSLHALATLSSGGLPGFMSALSLKQVQGLAGDGGITRRKLSLAAGHETNTAGGGETPHTPSNWNCQGMYWITGPSTSLAGWVIFPLNELLVHGCEFNELRVSVAAAGGAANRIAVAVYRSSGNGSATQLGSTQNNAGVGGLQHLTVSDFSTTADLWEYTYFVTVQQLIAGAGDLILDVRAGFSFP